MSARVVIVSYYTCDICQKRIITFWPKSEFIVWKELKGMVHCRENELYDDARVIEVHLRRQMVDNNVQPNEYFNESLIST